MALLTAPSDVDASKIVPPHLAASRSSRLASVSLVGVSMYFGNVPTATGSSCAGLCERGRPGRFGCGAQGVKGMACQASGSR